MKKADLKMVGLVAVGVMVAGLAMYHGRNVALIDDARRGYDM